MNKAIIGRYRCPEQFVTASVPTPLSAWNGHSGFGDDLARYGQSCSATSAGSANGLLTELLTEIRRGQPDAQVPFDLSQLVENLTHERYLGSSDAPPGPDGANAITRRLYYLVRPLLPARFRIPLQRLHFRGWNKISFPSWPVDVGVERLLETALRLSMKSLGIDSVPFIWFWPEGASSAALLTHDVETEAGRDFCPRLMDIDESFGLRSAFQIVPEGRYPVPPALLEEIRSRGHEINVHDLNHDGNLYRDREEFLARVKAVNEYGRQWNAKGFRSAILYRKLDWYDQLEFEYDMSVPNVGHLEAQRGGCCTTFPYFIGDILELPLTTTQDYSLFHILREHRIDLWRAQAQLILEKHGLLSFITHPDYLIEDRAQNTYRHLLDLLSELESEHQTWIALPEEVNNWWRQRSQMRLVPEGNSWRIEGPGKERARLAYARFDGQRLVYAPDAVETLAS